MSRYRPFSRSGCLCHVSVFPAHANQRGKALHHLGLRTALMETPLKREGIHPNRGNGLGCYI
ncbi:hypothetical protein I7I53_00445 [Histoplasma capsulatum var. duboisii H88]|uniref:Uncharacterized protein n=1 Tax=Ajellomyces capsulatus (strain H88) TaxID=544711 RepID=A0A8A1LGS0_AJEC8|nr:hypothetical protein I7I53_00445 [Histoplasma capsulatum var. duboisii H88]